MLYTKIQPQSFLDSGEEDFECCFFFFLPYMPMVDILFSSAKSFEEIDNALLTEGPMWNLVKIGRAVLEKKTLKD